MWHNIILHVTHSQTTYLLEPVRISTHQPIDLLSSLDEQKCRHRRHTILLCRLGIFIHIHLDKLYPTSQFVRQFVEDGGNHLALWMYEYIRCGEANEINEGTKSMQKFPFECNSIRNRRTGPHHVAVKSTTVNLSCNAAL